MELDSGDNGEVIIRLNRGSADMGEVLPSSVERLCTLVAGRFRLEEYDNRHIRFNGVQPQKTRKSKIHACASRLNGRSR